MRLVFATGNQGKVKEVQALLADLGAKVDLMSEMGVDMEIVENGTTFEENAKIKSDTVMQVILEEEKKALAEKESGAQVSPFFDGAPVFGVLSDDSGLEVSLVVTVTDPRGNTSVLNELTFTGDTIGTYVVEYIATDVSGKETRQLYNFVVMLLWEEDPGQTTDEPGCAGGCSSSAGRAVLPGLVLSAAAAVLILRKKEQN